MYENENAYVCMYVFYLCHHFVEGINCTLAVFDRVHFVYNAEDFINGLVLLVSNKIQILLQETNHLRLSDQIHQLPLFVNHCYHNIVLKQEDIDIR